MGCFGPCSCQTAGRAPCDTAAAPGALAPDCLYVSVTIAIKGKGRNDIKIAATWAFVESEMGEAGSEW